MKIKNTNTATLTNERGEFTLTTNNRLGEIEVSFIGYKSKVISFTNISQTIVISLEDDHGVLEEVMVSTGYQKIPKERATGSFVFLDSVILNRRVSANILDRLDGVTSGVLFNAQTGLGDYEVLNVRGRTTFLTKGEAEALIVLDNFPYEGSVNDINPNDIESITILKDAAAASIWGTRSGNGVIVITSKRGRLNQKAKINFNSNFTLGRKPDIYYDPYYISSTQFIEAQKYLFDKGHFDADLAKNTSQRPVYPIIETLASERKGELEDLTASGILDEFRAIDIRDEYLKYMYQSNVNQQYSLGIQGGGNSMTYKLSAGFDDSRSHLVRNSNDRFTFNSLSTYNPVRNLEIDIGFVFTKSTSNDNNKVYFKTRSTEGGPYTSFVDNNGNALSIVRTYHDAYKAEMEEMGFLDWSYRPLDELKFADNQSSKNSLLLKGGIKYTFIPRFNLRLQYQQEKHFSSGRDHKIEEVYEVRDYINRFAQYNEQNNQLEFIFPRGGILDLIENRQNSYNLRTQLDFNPITNERHSLLGIIGAEIRQTVGSGFNRKYIGYDDEIGTSSVYIDYLNPYPTNPTGRAYLPGSLGLVSGTTSRYFSTFINAAYSFHNLYTFSASARKDGANIFGVKANDKITPLWSAGLAWNISGEKFYQSSLLTDLKLRVTYGFNGNVYNASSYLTSKYTGSPNILGLLQANVTRPPNPNLRWERVKNINFGIDYMFKNKRFFGSVDFYRKEGLDLIVQTSLASSTGFKSFTGNAANNRIKGLDLIINSRNLTGKFKWDTQVLYNFSKDRITDYNQKYTNSQLTSLGGYGSIVGIEGNSMYSIYSYRWKGIDANNGDPIGYLNGEISKDWQNINLNTPIEELVYHGSGRPTKFGSIRNVLSFRSLSLSMNLTYKFNYFFRRDGLDLNYSSIVSMAHKDYAKRWKVAGDELENNVPSMVYPSNSNRNTFYKYSEALVEKGDHIRFQDISLSYDVNVNSSFPLHSINVYAYVNNVGLLWKANEIGLDPDHYNSTFVSPTTISLGVKAVF